MKADSQTTVREIALEYPQAARVFESFGIDYCCGGKLPLNEACKKAGIGVDQVLEELERPAEADLPDDHWNSAPLAGLTDHIVQKHHSYVRRESPRLAELLNKVCEKHGDTHPELYRVGELFGGLTAELATHMLKEERVLFPMIQRLEEAAQSGPGGGAGFQMIQYPVHQMISEHDNAGEVVAGIRTATSQYQPPADACPTYRAVYQGLQEFERDLRRHIHLENNILFPRAVRMTGAAEEVGSVSS